MIELMNFDKWIKPEDLSEASGTSEKMWLRSPDGEKTGHRASLSSPRFKITQENRNQYLQSIYQSGLPHN